MDLDYALHAQAESLVRKAIAGPSGTPDWSSILKILGLIDSSSVIIPTFVEVICKTLSRGKKSQCLNCLILIDALFKNSKKQQLSLLQSAKLVRQLNSPIIQHSPELHNFLYKNAPSWVSNCSAQNCLEQFFSSWQESVCRMHYVPKMTEAIRKKLSNDLDASLEVLVMFGQCLIASFADGNNPNDPLLNEIVVNIREIARRIAELMTTVVDRQMLAAIQAESTFCEFCMQAYNDYKKSGIVDTNAVILATTKAQNSVKKHLNAEKNQTREKEKKRGPIRVRGQLFDEMSVDDFFKEFDKIKNSEPSPPSVKPVANLLDFDETPVGSNENQTQKPQTDDLIDSLLQI